jgi:hypothetical protein
MKPVKLICKKAKPNEFIIEYNICYEGKGSRPTKSRWLELLQVLKTES